MRVRSTTRARRLLVPRARTEEAFVRIAGATMAVRTAKGLPARDGYCTAEPFLSLSVWRISSGSRLGCPRHSSKALRRNAEALANFADGHFQKALVGKRVEIESVLALAARKARQTRRGERKRPISTPPP